MAVNKDDVKYIAKLSRIKFTEQEEENFLKGFNSILDHVAKINSVNTDGIEPCSNVFSLHNVLREDKAQASYSPEKLLENAPAKEDNAYLVPKVVE